jgi:hypothetical protein
MLIHSHSYYPAYFRWQGAVKHLRIGAAKAAFLAADGYWKSFIPAFLPESLPAFLAPHRHDAEGLPGFLGRNRHDAESLPGFLRRDRHNAGGLHEIKAAYRQEMP